MKRKQNKTDQRWLMTLVAPLGVLLVAGVVFVRITDGKLAALHFAFVQLLVLLVAIAVSRALSSHFLRRLWQLQRSAERIEAGHFVAVQVGPENDEFSDLARAFNHMVEVIESREGALRDHNAALAEVNHRMETVLNATNDGIALIDKEGRFALVNRRFCEMLGARAEALLYRPATEAQVLITSRLAKPETLLGRLGPFTEEDLTHPIGVAEDTIEVAGVERRFIQVYTAPVRDDHHGMTGRLLALHDITRETEVDRMKTDFISVVSHELRTPLTSIKGYSDLLLNEQAGPVNEIQREFLTILEASTTRLNNLINDMLDISRLESGRADVKNEPVDLQRAVRDVMRLMQAMVDQREISVDLSFPTELAPVRGDTDKIIQILTNLVSNAVKYTPVGGSLSVSIEQSSTAVTTCIADSGIGISEEDLPRLFQKFFRADNSSTREAGGTGLGLAIVKTLIELLGGAVWVESEAGKGSKFFFMLPVYDEFADADTQPMGDAPDGDFNASADNAGGYRGPAPGALIDRGLGLVLLIDDDRLIRERLQHALHRMGYGVIAESDPDDALQRARVHRPEVILLDIMMNSREMAGFAILRALQDDPATAALPIVAYSLAGDPAQGSLALGAFSFLQKPIPQNILVKSLRERFGKHRDISLLLVELEDVEGESETDLRALADSLRDTRIILTRETSAAAAVRNAIGRRPDAILLDAESEHRRSEMFDLLKALKSEEDLSRIPLILLTTKSSGGVENIHLGGASVETAATIEYLSEQIGRIVRSRAITRSGNASADDGKPVNGPGAQ